MYNTRIAPSPTGYMHIGTARTAYFSYLAARITGGKFILRIDDTDKSREVDGAIDIILESMEWLNLDYDDIFYQSSRIDRYKSVANDLLKANLAKKLDNGAIALNLENISLPNFWHDEVAGDIQVTDKNKEVIKDTILIKGGDNIGQPIYHFASVVDDYDYNINYIIRGNDHTSNTIRQIAIWNAIDNLNYSHRTENFLKFAHVGLIHKNKKKMSKRDADSDPTIFLSYYKENDYEPEAVLNFLARMGWGPTVDDKTTAILPRERMLELFLDGGKMRSASSNFDMDKLNSFNRKYKAIIENKRKNGMS